eukprot:748812-Ditylum_brightwellii.AAC.1
MQIGALKINLFHPHLQRFHLTSSDPCLDQSLFEMGVQCHGAANVKLTLISVHAIQKWWLQQSAVRS